MKRRTKAIASSIVGLCVFAGVAVAASPEDAMKATPDAQQPADDSGRNIRDRDGTQPTAGQQPNDADDLKLTQSIRKAVVADDSLSVNAHNVKIITQGGVVTLRGPVKNEDEKRKIEEKARAVSGVTRVDNLLEIAG